MGRCLKSLNGNKKRSLENYMILKRIDEIKKNL